MKKGIKLGNGINQLTWRSYNSIKKKAMEQEFSWSGLVVSLSIAFFIAIASAQFLSITSYSLINERNNALNKDKHYYQLEKSRYGNPADAWC